ncbi:hypothetical protein PLESTB_000083700 [Pleodorina starrii]|uniref:phosphatidylinositol-3,4,5-trisphosphate 3-phosphatase n=1 Tax=Pleodorina starrii TaxID=330485 RepID=A0A9W6BA01_9CHLO|nr:hypothetical protein PLESTM_000080100 [Pleodorina starrii]GLC48324.1 hypothetical protein PLESTB_000083700 [Pleodorina starrii]GLC66609.1 hypothetical protein PLESTF_000449500 [Pleodorina starrii]
MAFLLRRLVSTNKRRYQQDGYDLDLSYITPRIIAMGFPCDGVSRLYRNPLGDVVRLLEERHAGRYKVYNLCVERGYDPRVFQGRVMRVPMYDGQAPPLHLMLDVCRDAAAWLAADPNHVVALHCKAGKGRTGAVVCALLLAMDSELGPASLERVLALWAERRTRDAKGLSIPSQRRFVGHFHQLLLSAPASWPEPAVDELSNAGELRNGQQALQTHPQPQAPQPPQPPTPQPADEAWRPAQPGLRIPPLLAAAAVPRRAVRLLRLRFRGLPAWLLQDCTASVWWRPAGHYEAHAVCHVRTRTAAGCAGCAPDSAAVHRPGTGSAAWAIRRCDAVSGGGGSGASSAQELCLDLTALAPLQAPQPPSPLPYYAPDNGVGPSAKLPGPGASDAAACLAASSSPAASAINQPQATPGLDGDGSGSGQRARGTGVYVEYGAPAVGVKPGPPAIAGDVKIQLFRGALADPPHDVFKGSVTQLSAWICTSYLDPRVGSLELGRAELDKLSKRLRRWRGAVGVVLEYETLAQ